MAQQQGSPFQSVAELGAAAVQAGIAFWWRWPALIAGGIPARDPAEIDRQEKDKAATARVVAAQIEAMRILAQSIKKEAPADAPARVVPTRRNPKTKSKRRHKG
jgi:hypothetical protein